jgi:hypothetical protein
VNKISRAAVSSAMICSLLTAGCGSKQTGPVIEFEEVPGAIGEAADEALQDPARAQQVMDEAAEMDAALRKLADETWDLRARFFYLNANYDVAAEDFEALLEELQDARNRRQSEILDIALKTRSIMSESEWNAFEAELADRLDVD